MRFASLAVVLVLALSVCALAVTPTAVMPEKNSVVNGVNIPDGRVGGETIATATVIAGLPYTDAGNTCVFADDYDEACPYTGSTSPDCVYAFTPGVDMTVDMFLCMSSYDTKIFVYENVHTPGAPYACIDDNGDCANFNTYLYQSWLTEVALFAGNTYYIVVDGYGGDCGDYILDVYEVEECVVDCPPDALLEGEVDCYDDYDDVYNAGCNNDPEVYTTVDCSNEQIVICGTSGVYDFAGSLYRDTDWYMLTLDEAATVTIGVEAEFGVLCGFVDLSGGCANAAFYAGYISGGSCTYMVTSAALPAGQTPVFVSTNDWDPTFLCGSNYYLTIDGYECTSPVEESNWGAIKALYR
ncbi:hypothetical protein K8S17_06820 [bacterium]|nr:hypothetical protein [bacterium]